MHACPRLLKPASFLVAVVGLLATSASAKTEWDPISPEDLAATECKSHPGASAEVLFSRQTLEASRAETWTTHDTRIKIYSPKGTEESGVLNIDYPVGYGNVWDLAARVTKPNGTSTELGKNDFHDSLFAKVGGYKWNRKTLAVPNLGPGDIVELKWSESTGMYEGTYYWWYCQETVPVRHFSFVVNGSHSDYRIMPFNLPTAQLKKINSHQVGLEAGDLAPFVEEPEMAPMRDVRGWFVVLFMSEYWDFVTNDPEWKETSSSSAEDFRLLTKPNQDLKSRASGLIQGAASDEEKLQRLYDFCQQHISNFDYFDSPELQKAKKKIDDNPDRDVGPGDTLSRGSGYPRHINELFAALAQAAGFEVRRALSASREATLEVHPPIGLLFLRDHLVAVRLGDAWKYYSPGDYFMPAGMIKRANEFATALICDKKSVMVTQIPVAPASRSPVTRKGRFTLDADGNLEGEVEVSLGGHVGVEKKSVWHKKEPNEIDTEYRATITKSLSSAEVGDLTWGNLRGTTLPLTVTYKLKVPGYADLAGSKIVLVPNVFAHGKPAPFSSDIRLHPIFFPYAWSEHDDIEIALPEGYTLDAASAPANVGDPAGALGVRYYVGYKAKSRVLTYRRDFALGENGAIAFQAASYPAVKKLWDGINRSDEHAIVFKPVPPAPAPATENSAPPAK